MVFTRVSQRIVTQFLPENNLQSNNIDLQAILNTINELPEAGGEQATPVISVSSNGLITAVAGTKSATKQLAFQPAKTITPTTASQTAVSSGYYTGGNIIVAGDSNLVAGNIKSGVSIFGVNGTLEEGGEVDYSVEDGLITRTLTSYTNDRLTTIGNYAFYYCSRLTTVSFPVASTIQYGAFSSCYALTTASFPAATTIGGYAFARCYNLKSLYLTGSSLCKLSNSNAFSSTPIGGYSASAGTYGSIYVPSSLLASYKTATNWTYFSSRFVAIGSSESGSGDSND